MRRLDSGAVGEIGDAAGDAQDAVQGAGGKAQAICDLVEQCCSGGVGLAVLMNFARRQGGVGFALPGILAGLGGDHALAHDFGGVAVGGLLQGFGGDQGDFGEQVDAVDERPGKFAAIAADLIWCAAAAAGSIAVKAARTGVHGSDELEAGGENGMAGGAGDVDAAGFERLAQGFQHFAIEFG